jgi:tetratricopeptide (TPR) repeat protein
MYNVALPLLLALAAEGVDAASAAQSHTARATAEFNLGRYAEAAKEFENAYRLVPVPDLLFNLGQSYRLGGKLDKALTAYKSFLRTAPTDSPQRAQVERHVVELDERLAPLPAPRTPAPGRAAPARASVPARTAPPSPTRNLRPTIVAAGITAALATGAVVAGLGAGARYADLQGTCGKAPGCTESPIDSVKSRARTANILWALTAVGAVGTGVTFYFTGRETGVRLAWRF